MAMLRCPVMLLAVGLAAAIWGPWLGAGPGMMHKETTRFQKDMHIIGRAL